MLCLHLAGSLVMIQEYAVALGLLVSEGKHLLENAEWTADHRHPNTESSNELASSSPTRWNLPALLSESAVEQLWKRSPLPLRISMLVFGPS